MSRRHSDRHTESLSLSFLDVLANGVAAAVVLLLLFSVVGEQAKGRGGFRDLAVAGFEVTSHQSVALILEASPIKAGKVEASDVTAFRLAKYDGASPRQTLLISEKVGGLPAVGFFYMTRDKDEGAGVAAIYGASIEIASRGERQWLIRLRVLDADRYADFSPAKSIPNAEVKATLMQKVQSLPQMSVQVGDEVEMRVEVGVGGATRFVPGYTPRRIERLSGGS